MPGVARPGGRERRRQGELLDLANRLYHTTYDLVSMRLAEDVTPVFVEAEVIECEGATSSPAMMQALDDALAGLPRRYPMPGPEPTDRL